MSMLKKKLPKVLMVLTIITTSLISTSFAPVYAASPNQASQATIQFMKSETPKMTTNAKPSTAFKVTLNGSPVKLSAPILVDNGSTLLPVRAIGELLGININYDGAAKVAIASDSDTVLEVPLGYTFGVNNGKKVGIAGTRSTLYNSTTYLPLRFMSEQLGLTITYNNTTKTIGIVTSGTAVTPKPTPSPPTPTPSTPAPTPTPSPAPTPTPSPSTPTVTPSTGKSPQAVFDNGGKLKDMDAASFKSFGSTAEIKKLLPIFNDTAAQGMLKSNIYTTVTMNIKSNFETLEGYDVVISKDRIGLTGPANYMVMFKDGTYQKGTGTFKDGKDLNDVSYLAYTYENRVIFINIGTVNMSALD